MKDRLLEIRNALNLNQEEFGRRIGLSKPSISALENGSRNVTDRHIMLICSELTVSEDWMRYGKGEMFAQPTTFSLDEYAKKNNLSELEANVIKGYMELDGDMRKKLMSYFKTIFNPGTETAAELAEKKIDDEVESYRRELEDEQKGATLSALSEQKGKSM